MAFFPSITRCGSFVNWTSYRNQSRISSVKCHILYISTPFKAGDFMNYAPDTSPLIKMHNVRTVHKHKHTKCHVNVIMFALIMGEKYARRVFVGSAISANFGAGLSVCVCFCNDNSENRLLSMVNMKITFNEFSIDLICEIWWLIEDNDISIWATPVPPSPQRLRHKKMPWCVFDVDFRRRHNDIGRLVDHVRWLLERIIK